MVELTSGQRHQQSWAEGIIIVNAGLAFAVVDFETAHPPRHSICQVGTTIVLDGMIEATYQHTIIPPTGLSPFTSTHVHGLTADYVAEHGHPWTEVEPRVRDIIGTLPVVAHNAVFDKSVYMRSCEATGLNPAQWEWLCTRRLSERLIGVGGLADACAHLKIDQQNHHQAGADSYYAAKVALLLAERTGAETVTELWQALAGPKASKASAKLPRPSRMSQTEFLRHSASAARRRYKSNADFPPPNPKSTKNLLKGETVLITGEIPGWEDRDEAYDAVAAAGGQGTNTLSRKTTIVLAGDGAGPTKLDKASALGINIILGSDAADLLNPRGIQ